MNKPTITLLNPERQIGFNPEESLLQNLLQNGIDISHSCGGMGTCGTCRVVVETGHEKLLPPDPLESDFSMDRGFLSNERLSCQTKPVAGIKIRIP